MYHIVAPPVFPFYCLQPFSSPLVWCKIFSLLSGPFGKRGMVLFPNHIFEVISQGRVSILPHLFESHFYLSLLRAPFCRFTSGLNASFHGFFVCEEVPRSCIRPCSHGLAFCNRALSAFPPPEWNSVHNLLKPWCSGSVSCMIPHPLQSPLCPVSAIRLDMYLLFLHVRGDPVLGFGIFFLRGSNPKWL